MTNGGPAVIRIGLRWEGSPAELRGIISAREPGTPGQLLLRPALQAAAISEIALERSKSRHDCIRLRYASIALQPGGIASPSGTIVTGRSTIAAADMEAIPLRSDRNQCNGPSLPIFPPRQL